MKYVIEFIELSGGSTARCLMAYEEDGQPNLALTNTLLNLLEQLHAPDFVEFSEFLDEVEAGSYLPANPDLPDWNSNDVCIWAIPSCTQEGWLVVSNENVESVSMQSGAPMMFTISALRVVLDKWKKLYEKLYSDKAKSLWTSSIEFDFGLDLKEHSRVFDGARVR